MDGVRADATVAVLHTLQPLTTDPAALADDVVVLTHGPPGRVARADASPPPRVVSRSRSQWEAFMVALSAQERVEVVTNDEFCLAHCAELRRAAGLARVTPSGLDGYLDKVVMEQRLGDAGVLVPRWERLDPSSGPASGAVPARWCRRWPG